MNFYKRYELQRLIATGEAKTFRAVETATGRAVFVHMFDAGKPDILSAMKSKLTVKGGLPVAPLLECGEFAGAEYAVTEPIEAFVSLRDWVLSLPGSTPAADMAPPVAHTPAGAPPEQESGEFTRLFGPPGTSGPPPGLLNDGTASRPRAEQAPPFAAPAPQVAPVAHTPAGTPPEQESGEFTRLFGPPDTSGPPPQASPRNASPGLLNDNTEEFSAAFPNPSPIRPAPPAPLPAPALPTGVEPGEADMGDFTRAFGPAPPASNRRPAERIAPVPQPIPAVPQSIPTGRPVEPLPNAPPEWSASGDTGEFTRLFGTGMAGEDIDIAEEQARAAQSPAQEHRPFQDAGEFTRVFGPEATAENPNPPRRPAPFGLNTSASGLFDEEEPVRSAGGSTIEADTPAVGGYNETFGARPVHREQPKGGPPKQVSPAQLDKPKNSRRMVAWLVGGGVLIVALAVLAIVLSR